MSKGNHSEASKGALVVIEGALITDKKQLASFQQSTAEQIGIVGRTESLNVKRRLFVGLALLTIKASLKHGEWLPWFKRSAPGASYRQCAYMMAAAQVLIEKARSAQNELPALAAGNFALEVKDGAPKKLVAAAEDFVGELTWGELLEKHDLKGKKKLGGRRTAGAKDGGAPSNEELYQFARDEIGLVLNHAETLFLKENRLQHLADHPEEIRGVVASIRKLADQVEAAAKPILKK